MDKRQFLKLSTGVSLGFILPNGVNAANTLQVLKSDMRWPSYSNSVVIDGLSAAFDYGVESFDNNVLAIFKQSGISALNATIPSPGDDHATTLSKIESTLALIKRYPSHFRLVTKARANRHYYGLSVHRNVC